MFELGLVACAVLGAGCGEDSNAGYPPRGESSRAPEQMVDENPDAEPGADPDEPEALDSTFDPGAVYLWGVPDLHHLVVRRFGDVAHFLDLEGDMTTGRVSVTFPYWPVIGPDGRMVYADIDGFAREFRVDGKTRLREREQDGFGENVQDDAELPTVGCDDGVRRVQVGLDGARYHQCIRSNDWRSEQGDVVLTRTVAGTMFGPAGKALSHVFQTTLFTELPPGLHMIDLESGSSEMLFPDHGEIHPSVMRAHDDHVSLVTKRMDDDGPPALWHVSYEGDVTAMGEYPSYVKDRVRGLLDETDHLYVVEDGAQLFRHTVDSDEAELLYSSDDEALIHVERMELITGYHR